MHDKTCGMAPAPSKINLINCITSGVVKMGRDAVLAVPGGGLKVPCYGAGSSQKAGFHLDFEPKIGLKGRPMD